MLKKEKLTALITGIALFAVAAVFMISVFLGILDFGTSRGNSGILYRFGTMLVSVYGVSGLLIPVFFFVAGCLCFDARWSVQRLVCLLISVIPFLTLAFSERAARSIAANDSSPIAVVKIITLLVIAVLLVAAEYLVALLLGTRIAQRTGARGAERAVKSGDEDESFTAEDGVEISFEDDESGDSQDGTGWEKEAEDEPLESAAGREVFADDESGIIDEQVEKSIASAAEDSTWSLADILSRNRRAIESHVESRRNKGDETEEINVNSDPWNVIRNSGALDDGPDEKDAENDTSVVYELPSSAVTVSFADTADAYAEKDEVSAEEDEEDAPGADFPEHEETQEGDESESVAESDYDADDDVFPGEEDGQTALAADSEDSTDDEIIFDDPALDGYSGDDADDDPIAEFERENMEHEMFGGDALDDGADDFSGEEFSAGLSDIEISDEAGAEPEVEEEDVSGLRSADLEKPGEREEPAVLFERRADTSEKKTENKLSPLESVFARMDADVKAQIDSGNGKVLPDESAPVMAENDLKKTADDLTGAGRAGSAAVSPVSAPVPASRPRHRGAYKIPTELLKAYDANPYWIIDAETTAAAENLKNTLKEFKIDAEVTGIKKGPVVTMFEILPAPGVKLSRIVALQDNIALRLAASSVRIVAPIPGKHAVGIEVPNKDRAIISMRECLELDRPEWKRMAVPVVLGKDIQGEAQIIDLAKTPHLLIAGSTGAGKSVCVNSMILSILYKRSPNEVKMILIDPKIVELKLYNDIPHLLTPVITEPKRAMQSLQYCLCEMERRYALLDHMSVRDISSYNKKISEKGVIAERLPYLIVIIDEFADLMATTGKQLEGVLARLAAMSRAVGIHLVLATQRPSIDVITGLIKANIPSRIAFMVAGKMDSRIIIDQVGAEKLLGKGDMLYASATDPFPVRIQGTFVSDQEVEDVVNKVKEWGEPEYIDDEIFVDDDEDDDETMSLFTAEGDDPLYNKALEIVMQTGKASASYIQRKLKIGYNRAARLVEEMEQRGIVGPANGSKPREIIQMPS